MTSNKKREILQELLIPVIAVVLSLLIGGIIIALLGFNPFDAYGALIQGSMGSLVSFTMTLKTSVPLILAGLAVAVAFKSSAFNIGVEGQLMFGGLCAGLVGIYVPLPPGLHLVVTLLAGMLGGALVASSSCSSASWVRSMVTRALLRRILCLQARRCRTYCRPAIS